MFQASLGILFIIVSGMLFLLLTANFTYIFFVGIWCKLPSIGMVGGPGGKVFGRWLHCSSQDTIGTAAMRKMLATRRGDLPSRFSDSVAILMQ
jgi:hypothetical protein